MCLLMVVTRKIVRLLSKLCEVLKILHGNSDDIFDLTEIFKRCVCIRFTLDNIFTESDELVPRTFKFE